MWPSNRAPTADPAGRASIEAAGTYANLASVRTACYSGTVRLLRYTAVVLLSYVAAVVAFEVYLGIAQPKFETNPHEEWGATIVITTASADGSTKGRVVSPMVSDGHLYVSANHWPRSWYKRVLENPKVQVTNKNETKDYLAVAIPAASEEHDRLEREHPHPAWFRFLTGYPPRRFVRLESR